MYILTYSEFEGYEPHDARFENLAISENVSKLEQIKQELLVKTEQYDQEFEKWRLKKNEILKKYLMSQIHAFHMSGCSYSDAFDKKPELENWFGIEIKDHKQLQILRMFKNNLDNPYIHEKINFKYNMNEDALTESFPEIEKYPLPESNYYKHGTFTIEEIKEV